ncbi:MAG: phosphoribosylamine--glycine ligase N-terminal domain-containing protein, partial [Caulobacteraceae bacterium]
MTLSPMTILLIGSGGREHALAWKIAQSPLCQRLVAAPGNPGIERLCETRPVKATDVDGLAALAQEIGADLVVVGPES